MQDDLLGVVLGCSCREKCCCHPQEALRKPNPGGNLFPQQARTTPPARLPDESPFVPPLILSLDSPQRPGLHQPGVRVQGDHAEFTGSGGSGAVSTMQLDDGTEHAAPADYGVSVDYQTRTALPVLRMIQVESGPIYEPDLDVQEQRFVFQVLPNGTPTWGLTSAPSNQPPPYATYNTESISANIFAAGSGENVSYLGIPVIEVAGSYFAQWRGFGADGLRFDGQPAPGVGAVSGVGQTGQVIGEDITMTFNLARTAIHADGTTYRVETTFTPDAYRLAGRVQQVTVNGQMGYTWQTPGLTFDTLLARVPDGARAALTGDGESGTAPAWIVAAAFIPRSDQPTTPNSLGAQVQGRAVVIGANTSLSLDASNTTKIYSWVRQGLPTLYAAATEPYTKLARLLLGALNPTRPAFTAPQRLFRSQNVEVWGQPRQDVHDLGQTGELRVNGRTYTGGSWCGLYSPLDGRVWVLHLAPNGLLTREIVGGAGPPQQATVSEFAQGGLRQMGATVTALRGYTLRHTWPHDRADAVLADGRRLAFCAWQPWRDATRAEWRAAQASRPRRAWGAGIPPTHQPTAPPLSLTLADLGSGWPLASKYRGVPYVLPSLAQRWDAGTQAWHPSISALNALAKAQEWPGVSESENDRSSVRGRLRVTFPNPDWPHPAQAVLLLRVKVGSHLPTLTVDGLALTPVPLGREVYQNGKLTPGFHSAYLPVPDLRVFTLETTQPLSRLLLTWIGAGGGGTAAS